MLRSTLPLLACALLLPACQLAADPGKYAPKEPAQCGAFEKACGYRCVPVDDPATGCAAAGCEPCAAPSGPNQAAVCSATGACAIGCAAGLGDCNGSAQDGCEQPLTGDAHCGACGHACAGGASSHCQASGTCTPDVEASAVTDPRGLTVGGDDKLYFAAGGRLYTPGPEKEALVVAEGLGDVAQVRARGTWIYVAGGPNGAAEVWGYDTTAKTATRVDQPGGNLLDLEVSWNFLYESLLDSAALRRHAGTPSAEFVTFPAAGTRTGGVTVGPPPTDTTAFPVLVADDDGGGAIHYYGEDGTAYAPPATGLPGVASRLTAQLDPDGKLVAWGTFPDTGSLVRVQDGAVALVHRGPGAAQLMDLCSDAAGVYWSDADRGIIWEWRASDGAVFPLAIDAVAYALTVYGARVYWTELHTGEVRSVPK